MVTLTRSGRGRLGLILGKMDDDVIVDDVVPGEAAAT